MARKLEFWFEFASTYSYLSAMRIESECAARDIALVWRPFALGPVFAQYGWRDSPFNIFPAKGVNMWRDMERECRRLGLPLQRPDIFPQNSMTAGRVACLLQDQPQIGAFVRAVYQANFSDNRDISDPAVLGDLLGALDLDAGALLDQVHEAPAKAAYRSQTEAAIARGIYGAPSFLVGDELFWGNDRLDRAMDWAVSDAAD